MSLFSLSIFQDLGDFNIATSSLHALSNSLSRTEKQSPHSSPRMPRKSTTSSSSSCSSASSGSSSTQHHFDLYAGQPSHSSGGINGSPGINGLACSSKSNRSGSSGSLAQAQNPNRMSAPVISNVAPVGKILHKALSSDPTGGGLVETAPPLPPRKSSPGIDQVPQAARGGSVGGSGSGGSVAKSSNASSLITLSPDAPMASTSAIPVDPIMSCCDLEVPKTCAPPVPKHQTNLVDTIAEDFTMHVTVQKEDEVLEDEGIIVGPAETISGIIDTRPLEARKPISVVSQSVPLGKEATDRGNNLYQLKTTQNHTRHQSLPMNTATKSPTPAKSVTVAQLCQPRTAVTTTAAGGADSQAARHQAILYENVTINSKDCNVPYENINLEYIARLVNEGYSKENAITALGISRNNIEMACDILHEFVAKSGV